MGAEGAGAGIQRGIGLGYCRRVDSTGGGRSSGGDFLVAAVKGREVGSMVSLPLSFITADSSFLGLKSEKSFWPHFSY